MHREEIRMQLASFTVVTADGSGRSREAAQLSASRTQQLPSCSKTERTDLLFFACGALR